MTLYKKQKLLMFCIILFLIWLLAAGMISCSPLQRAGNKLRKAERLKREAIALGANVQADTIFTERAVFVPGKSTTIFQPVHYYHDTTFTVIKDRIKVVNKYLHDTLFQAIQCPDTVVKWKERTAINEVINCPPPDRTWRNIAFILIGLLTLIVVFVAKR